MGTSCPLLSQSIHLGATKRPESKPEIRTETPHLRQIVVFEIVSFATPFGDHPYVCRPGADCHLVGTRSHARENSLSMPYVFNRIRRRLREEQNTLSSNIGNPAFDGPHLDRLGDPGVLQPVASEILFRKSVKRT